MIFVALPAVGCHGYLAIWVLAVHMETMLVLDAGDVMGRRMEERWRGMGDEGGTEGRGGI